MKKSKKKALYESKKLQEEQNMQNDTNLNDRNLLEYSDEHAKDNIQAEQEKVLNMPHTEGEGPVMDIKTEVDFAKLALAEDELNRLNEQAGKSDDKWWQKLGDKYYSAKENRKKHLVNRKVYIWLCVLTGWFGGHRYYERRFVLAIIYTSLFWTALPFVFTIIDWMIAVPMQPDENGNILI